MEAHGVAAVLSIVKFLYQQWRNIQLGPHLEIKLNSLRIILFTGLFLSLLLLLLFHEGQSLLFFLFYTFLNFLRLCMRFLVFLDFFLLLLGTSFSLIFWNGGLVAICLLIFFAVVFILIIYLIVVFIRNFVIFIILIVVILVLDPLVRVIGVVLAL